MDRDQRISDNLVRLVQVIFGLVIAQSLLLYRTVIVTPGAPHYLAAAALVVVYTTTVFSWLDWHITMEFNPYNLNPSHPFKVHEQWRLAVDLFIVTVYAYTLFTIASFEDDPRYSLSRFLFAFPLFFLAYLVSGALRRITHGKHASNFRAIIEFGVAFSIVWLAYLLIVPDRFGPERQWVNLGVLVLILGLTFAYRLRRRLLRAQRLKRKDKGLRVGVDVDGVLANQINGILPRIKARHGIDLTYDEITDWQLPVGATSDVKVEIADALEDPQYILSMPIHSGAKRFMETLFEDHRLYVVTARPIEAKADTEVWLSRAGFPFDGLLNLKEKAKSMFQTDVLVDDYVGNISDYLRNSSGTAVLVKQPWNHDHSELVEWADDPRLRHADNMAEALAIVQELATVQVSSS